MSNIFHELGKTVNQKIGGLIDTFKSTNNIWTGTNDFLKSIGIGTDASAERSVDLKVGTEDTPQDLKAFGDIKVDGQQNLGNLADFTAALGQVANNGMASQIENLESRLHNLRTFYPNARPVAGEEIGEMIFDLEQSVILVWNGLEWLELGGKVPVTLKVFADGEGTVTGAGEYSKGEDVYVTATPNPNFGFKEWTGMGVDAGMVQSPTSDGTFINMSQSWTVTAKFGLVDHLLLVTVSGSGGTAEGNNTEWAHGTKATIKAIPGPNSDFIQWTGEGVDSPFSLESTVTMTSARTVEAVFSLKDHLLTLLADGGTATTTTGLSAFEHGAQAEITATPDSIHDFANWSGTGLSSDASLATATVDMTEPRTITANFSLKQYQLLVEAGIGGSTTGSGQYVHFESASISATADDANGYEFDNWTGSAVDSSSSPTTTVSITGETTVTANFKLKDYALSIDTYDLSNSQSGGGVTTGSGVRQHGESVTVTATANPEYDFIAWYNPTGNPVGDDHHNTTNTITMDDGAITIVANFRYKEYGLTVNAGTGGTASGTGTYSHFDQTDIEATPDDANGYEFEGWTKDSGDGNIANISVEDTTVEILSNTEVTANFKLKDYTLLTGAKFKGKISIGGYYPVYATANEANADTDGDGTGSHSHDINGVTYYMPNGLPPSEQYHGTHSIPWGDLGLYDNHDPVTGSWGSVYTEVIKQHGTSGGYSASPAQYHLFDSIEADSRWTFPWLDAFASAGPIEIQNNINFIANFSLQQYKLYIIHYPTSEWAPNALAPESAYWGDIQINGDPSILSSGAGAQEEIPGLIADGVWTSNNTGIRLHAGDFDAFSQQTIKAIPKANYGFLEWVEPAGQNLVTDAESSETTVTITPEGTNAGNQVELAARFGLLPISTFLTRGDFYFGETINFTDISTAPSGDGTVVSSVYTNDAGLPFSVADTAVRLFYLQDMYMELDNVGNNIFDFNEEFSILYYGNQFSVNVIHDTFSRGHFALGGYEGVNQILHYMGGNNFSDNWRCAGTNMPASLKTSDGYLNGGHVFRHDPSSGTYGKFNMRGLDPAGSTTSYGTDLATNYGAPTTFVSNSSSASTYPFIIGKCGTVQGSLGRGPCPVNYRDMLFVNRRVTDAEVDEFLAMDPGTYDQLSFYSEVVDWVEFGAQTYPNITGKKGVVSGSLKGSAISESNFKSIASLDLPSGSPGDTTGSVDVTLTVTDDQGLTDTETLTVNYTPAPLTEPSVNDAEIVLYEDATKTTFLLESPIVIGLQADYTFETESVVTISSSAASGQELTDYTALTGNTSASTWTWSTGGTSSTSQTVTDYYYKES